MYKEIENSTNSFIYEPVMEYYSKKSTLPDFSNQLTFNALLSDKLSLIKTIKAGLPFLMFEKIQSLIPFSDLDWANYLGLSTKSMQRYKSEANFQFKPLHSEKILELAEISLFGIDVFGEKEKFFSWLNTPSFALAGHCPIDLLPYSYGKSLVEEELNRIEHGIFA